MQCVIHYLMETAPGRTSSFKRNGLWHEARLQVWALTMII